MTESVPNWLEQRAYSSPRHPAVIYEGRAISYGELAGRVAVVSGRLRHLGVCRGDRLALLMANRPEFVEILHAAARVGAVVVPLNARLSPTEIAQQLADCKPRILFYDSTTRDTVAALRDESKVQGPKSNVPALQAISVDRDLQGGAAAFNAVAAEPDEGRTAIDLAAVHSILFTSGSSGRPKGVQLTFANVFWSAIATGMNLGLRADDRWLVCLPFCHVGGFSVLLRSVIYGATAVVHNSFDAERVDRALDDDRVTIISVVANMLQRLLETRGDRPAPPWLRCVTAGGGPVPLALLRASRELGFPVTQSYGLTETASQVTGLAPADAERKLGSAGKPLLGFEVDLRGADGPVVTGEVGEILVRGPGVSPGYLNPADDKNRDGGWLCTGDLGRFDDEGFLYIAGRCDDMIISGGENIYPAEVEAALQAHPAVAESCVFGVPDQRWGTAVAACVRLVPGMTATADDLAEHIRRHLARFKVPRRIDFVEDFPRTAAGKIIRHRVRAAVLAGEC